MRGLKVGLGLGAAALVAVAVAFGLGRGSQPAPARPAAAAPAQAARTAPVAAAFVPAVPAPAARTLSRDALLGILAELARLHAERDGVAFSALAHNTIEEFGASLAEPLAAILREGAAGDAAWAAAWLFSEVAGAADMPAVVELLGLALPDDVSDVLFEIALRIDPRAAAGVAASVLFDPGRSDAIRATAAAVLGAAGTPAAIQALGTVLRTAQWAPIQRAAAEALSSVRSAAAAREILGAWVETFDGSTEAARDRYFLLRALGTMGSEIAGEVVKGFLGSEPDASRRNLVLSVTPLLGAEFAFGIACDVLSREMQPQVREQAIVVLGSLALEEAGAKLIEILTAPRDAGDFIAAANALLGQASAALGFDAVRRHFEVQPDGVARAVLTVLLARDPTALKSDGAFLAGVWESVNRGLKSPEPLVQYFSLTAYALLAGVVERPVEHVRAVVEKLTPAQANQLPVLTEVLARHGDETAEPVWRDILANSEYASYHRLRAAEQLIALGRGEHVWEAVRQERDPGVKVLMANMLVAEEGAPGEERMREVAAQEEDGDTRATMEQQADVWSEIHRNMEIPKEDP